MIYKREQKMKKLKDERSVEYFIHLTKMINMLREDVGDNNKEEIKEQFASMVMAFIYSLDEDGLLDIILSHGTKEEDAYSNFLRDMVRLNGGNIPDMKDGDNEKEI